MANDIPLPGNTPAGSDNLRTLGPVLAIMIVAGCMIGSGVFMLPASLGGLGSVSILSWLVAAAGAGFIGGSLSWLAVLDHEGAGMFAYIRKAFGPAVGFASGLLYWAGGLPAAVAVAIACTGYFSVYVPQAAHGPGSVIVTAGFVWLLVGANWVGPRFVARVQGWTLALGLVPVLAAAFGGWFFFHTATFVASWNPRGESLVTLVPHGAVMAFWAFLGIEGAVILAPRIRDPRRNVALATLGGLGLAATIYIAACAALMGILPAAALARSSAPFADAARAMVGAVFAGAVALCALLKASGTLGGTLLMTMESLECDSVTSALRDAPCPKARVSGANLVFTGVVGTVIVLISKSPTLVRQFTIVTDVVVVLSMTTYAAVCLALVRAARALPWKKRIAAWAVGSGGTLFCIFIVAASESDLLVWSAIPLLGAFVAYGVVTAHRARRRAKLLEA